MNIAKHPGVNLEDGTTQIHIMVFDRINDGDAARVS
tara:strand:- start:453 stop:560 length:108 start_codon:yes stop_codon:yes gene_type:complete